MFIVLIAATPLKSLRGSIATAAFDHGLSRMAPGVFTGDMTDYRRRRFEEELRQVLRRRKPYHVELLTLPDQHYLSRLRLRR